MTYIGRFAPSPTGLLHFGSLLAALASYVDARAQQGQWLLRIEDLDPPREHPGARDQIPRTLENFGLHWDGTLCYQSDRLHLYQNALNQLIADRHAYRCGCSRKQVQQRTGQPVYDSYCLTNPPHETQDSAWRTAHKQAEIRFDDTIQGPQHFPLEESGDFVIKRKDGLFAYQLAVVVDDAAQGITHIVRGSDLLEETPRQIHLQDLLGYSEPQYSHIPVANNVSGQKLSKQNLAQPLDETRPVPQIIEALRFLGQQPTPELIDATLPELLQWAIENWHPDRIARQRAIVWEG